MFRKPQFPLLLLAGMLVTAVAIELAVYGTLLWQTKLPLAGLLAWAWLAPARPRGKV